MYSTLFKFTCLYLITVPDADLFTVLMHYKVGEIEGLAGYVDYCCADQMSRIELISMAKEFQLNVEGCRIWWLKVIRSDQGLQEIITDLDALKMALSVEEPREIYVCVTVVGDSTTNEAEGNFNNDAGVGVDVGEISRVPLLRDVEVDIRRLR